MKLSTSLTLLCSFAFLYPAIAAGASKEELEFPPPKSPQESLAAIKTSGDYVVELVAAEPLIVDPVAIDWGPDGKLWVVEMRDYPMGMDGNWKPGSRVKFLEDTNGDGIYDKATIFLDNLPFATGVTAWRKGALICTAPDVLYAEDTGGDGRADVVQKLFTGFSTGNYQARVNSLSLGLDNWIYGANGLLGGIIRGESRPIAPRSRRREEAETPHAKSSLAAGAFNSLAPSDGERAGVRGAVDIRGRDFRMNPDTGAFEPASGLTQQGRARDDWGNWLGCDNSTAAWHYPIPDHYLRRNPHVVAPGPRVAMASGADGNLLYPISHALERFNNPAALNRVTSGCGIGVYRDNLFGEDFYGNAFVCEPVHNLVHRKVLKPNGVTFTAVRAREEQQSEFLASRDNWFRPVQMRTGPDGAIWVVDMYRFVIEHPRWIPPERLAKLDPRAGDDKGRIYRVYPKGQKLRPIPDLTKLTGAKLAGLLDTPNGMERDRIHQELVFGRQKPTDKKTVGILQRLASKSNLPAVRAQALCVLDGLGALKSDHVERALADTQAAVRANAIRLSERFANSSQRTAIHRALADRLFRLVDDSELRVRYQLALTLGEWNDPRVGATLGKLAVRDIGDEWMRAAILSSATHQPEEILKAVLKVDAAKPERSELISQLIATAVGQGNPESLNQIATTIAPADAQHRAAWQLSALASLLDALERKNLTLENITKPSAGHKLPKLEAAAHSPSPPREERAGQSAVVLSTKAEVRSPIPAEILTRLNLLFDWATELANDSKIKESTREAAIRLLGRRPNHEAAELPLLAGLLDPSVPAPLQKAALGALRHNRGAEVGKLLISSWNRLPPSLRQGGIEVLLSREPWTQQMFEAVESGAIGRNEISLANRQVLFKSPNKEVQQVANKIWKSNPSGNRAEVVAKYRSALSLTGDPLKGRTVWLNNCVVCHYFRGEGNNVGPNLGALTDKTPADFLTAILDPNAAVEPRFVAYNIETKDGRSLTGVVNAETATTLTLVQGGGASEKILRSDIAEIRASGLSLMPEGLEQNISPQDLANLISYLNSAPHPFGSATPEQADAAKKKFLTAATNGVPKIVEAHYRSPHQSWMGELSLASCCQNEHQNRFAWETEPVPATLKPDATQDFLVPVSMGSRSGPFGKFTLRLNGKSVIEFDPALHDQTWHSADGKVRMSYMAMQDSSEESNGILTISVHSSLLEPGKPATFGVVSPASNSQRWFGVYEL